MHKTAIRSAALLGLSLSAFAQTPAKVTYTDHILPIFQNACTNCHNPDKKKAGLDLTTYQGTMSGGESGPAVKPGNADGSLIFKVCAHTQEPVMPPKGDKLSDAEMALLKGWIAGFALENATSKPAQVVANKVDAAVVSLTKPDGPPPMPGDLPLEPFVRSKSSNSVIALASSPWAPLVAVGGQKQVFLYNTETLERVGVLSFPEGLPHVLRFSRNAKLLLAGGGLGGKIGKVALWDVTTGDRVGVVGNEADAVLAADLSPDHKFVALGGPNKQVKVFQTSDGRQTGLIKKHTEWITAISYSPDGKYLATADRNGGVEVWEAGPDPKPFNTLAGHKVACTALAFMPGVLASASEDGKIALWNVKEGTEIRNWSAHGGGVLWVDFTPDGRVVSCGRDKVAKVWDATGKQIVATEALADLALRCALNSDRVIAADWTGDIRVFGIDGKKLGSLSANPGGITEALAAAEKAVVETQSALRALQKAVADAEAALKSEREAAEAKRKADIAAAEKLVAETKAALEAAKAAPANAQKAVEASKAELAKAQEAIASTRKAAVEMETAAGSKQRASAEAVAKSAQDSVSRAKAELAKRVEARGKTAAGSPEFAKADQQVKAFEPEVAKAEKMLADATKAVAGAPVPPSREKVEAAKAAMIAAQKTHEELRQQVQKAEADVARIRGTAPKTIADAEKSVQSAQASLAKAQQPLKREATAEDKQRVADLAKKVEAMKAALEERRVARGKFKEGSPEYVKLDAGVQARKADVAKADEELAAARAVLDAAGPTPGEKALAAAKSALDAAGAKLADAKAGVARWKRAAMYQTVFNARQTVAEKQARHDELTAAAKDAFRQVELARQGVTAAEKVIADGPKTVAAKEAELQKLKQAADADAAELKAAEKAVADFRAAAIDPKKIESEIADATKKLADLNAQAAKQREDRTKAPGAERPKIDEAIKALKPEITKAEAALAAAKAKQSVKPADVAIPAELSEAVKKAELEAKLSARKLPPAEKAVADAKKAIEDAKKQISDIKSRIAKMETDARKAKAEAEKAAVASARELEAAKAEEKRLRAQYEAAKGAIQKAASTTPVTPGKS